MRAWNLSLWPLNPVIWDPISIECADLRHCYFSNPRASQATVKSGGLVVFKVRPDTGIQDLGCAHHGNQSPNRSNITRPDTGQQPSPVLTMGGGETNLPYTDGQGDWTHSCYYDSSSGIFSHGEAHKVPLDALNILGGGTFDPAWALITVFGQDKSQWYILHR